jgi:hypothetical protein
MLDGTDVQTVKSVRLLTQAISASDKPLVLWVGAGASAWCGYPLWNLLADRMRSDFLKYESEYDPIGANQTIELENYPDFFQQCKDLNQQRYFSVLARELKARQITPVYQRLITALTDISPLHILTTNVDELLEKNLANSSTVQRSDFERCIDLTTAGQSFVCKLHGSVSAIQTAVFTTRDYTQLLADQKFLELLRHIFSMATVAFLGYGLADKYILDQISQTNELKPIYGDGPHFAIVPSMTSVPPTVNAIRYIPDPDKDHRSAIQIVEEIKTIKNVSVPNTPNNRGSEKATLQSAHLLSHIFPPGTYKSTQSATLTGGVGMIWGDGLTDAEMPSNISTAMHDIIVGLLCFDTIYAYLWSLGSIQQLVGEKSLTRILLSGALKFVVVPTQDVILYRNSTELNGILNAISFSENSGRALTGSELFDQQVQRILTPRTGADPAFIQAFFDLVKSSSVFYERSAEGNIKGLVGGLLLRESVRRLLGMSGGVSLNALPKWMIYPVLRLAYVVRAGVTCQLLGLASAKLDYGESELAGPAFAASTGSETADGMASYVMTGRFDCDLGTFNLRNEQVLDSILRFRETSQGAALRKEILDKLSLRLGADAVTSVNATLKAAIPSVVLQEAHDQVAGFLISAGNASGITPAIWNNVDYAKKALALWRSASARTLVEYCQRAGLKMEDFCPCASGEKLRDCCAESLTVSLR